MYVLAAGIGTPEIILIIVVILLVFGATRLPKLARSVGQSAKEFRKGLDEGGAVVDDPETPVTKPADAPKATE